MPKDRAADRHLNPGYVYRPNPPDLLKQVDETMGKGKRSRLVSDLLRRFLVGDRMPSPEELAAEWDKTGQDRGA